MNVFGLLSSIGGTLGLFIGIGALNIIEIIQLLCAMLGCSTAEYRPVVDKNKVTNGGEKKSETKLIEIERFEQTIT